MKALRLKNLRSLVDTGMVELRPITLLVGKNSSGKSTFARTFPLLKQSIEKTTESPILWFGKYVDFGSIEEAVRFGQLQDGISIGFDLPVRFVRGVDATHQIFETSTEIIVSRRTRGQGSYVSRICLELCGHKVEIDYDELGSVVRFDVNGENIKSIMEPLGELASEPSAFVLPRFEFIGIDTTPRRITYQPYFPPQKDKDPFEWIKISTSVLGSLLFEQTAERMVPEAGGAQDLFQDHIGGVEIGTAEEMRQNLRNPGGRLPQGTSRETRREFQTLVDKIFADDTLAKSCIALCVAGKIPDFLEELDKEIADFISRTAYMGPMRVRPERYLRVQDLAVEEVDHQGENLAMFLRSLSDAELRSFSHFTSTHYGFDIDRRLDGAHVQILVRPAGADQFANLVDIGFGYSQLLPLLALLWSTCARERKGRERDTSLVILEQPELHLHPGHQARIADLLVGAIAESRSAGTGTRVLVETHSEALVNRLGDLIQQGKVKANEVQIALFDHDPKKRTSSVRLAHYDDEGSLVDWPFGFFAPLPD